MKVTLKDGAPRSAGVVEINVSKNGNTLEIGASGVEPAPVVLELYNGKLTLRLFGLDGNQTDGWRLDTMPTIKGGPITPTVPPAQETINAVFPAPAAAPAAEFDEAAFDAA